MVLGDTGEPGPEDPRPGKNRFIDKTPDTKPTIPPFQIRSGVRAVLHGVSSFGVQIAPHLGWGGENAAQETIKKL